MLADRFFHRDNDAIQDAQAVMSFAASQLGVDMLAFKSLLHGLVTTSLRR